MGELPPVEMADVRNEISSLRQYMRGAKQAAVTMKRLQTLQARLPRKQQKVKKDTIKLSIV